MSREIKGYLMLMILHNVWEHVAKKKKRRRKKDFQNCLSSHKNLFHNDKMNV